MRVAYVISTLDAGGAERLLVEIVNNLPDEVSPSVFVLRNQLAIAGQIHNERAAVRVVGLTSNRDIRGWLRFTQGLRKMRPEVIHSHMFLSNIASRLLRSTSRAKVLVNHEHGLGDWKSRPLRLLDRWTQRRADRIIVASEASRTARIQGVGIEERRIRAMPNAIDWSYWNEEGQSHRGERVQRWGVAARLIPLKRVELALRLLLEARKAGFQGELRIAGDGPQRAHLERTTAEMGLASAVQFLGPVQDMRKFYREIDSLLLTSASEDCPMSLLEALASGLFVAATRVGGVPELLSGAPDCMIIDESLDLEAQARVLAGIPAGFNSAGNREHSRRYDIGIYVTEMMRLYTEPSPR